MLHLQTFCARCAGDRREFEELCVADRLVQRSFCDLFSEAGHLVHVKRRKGGSSGLSHLFGQAFVSSELLLREQAFATQMRSLLGVWANRVSEPPKAASHPVVLAVVLASESTGEGARALPFFSKVFMRQNVQTLQTMGFTVHYDEIPAQLTQTTP